MFKTNDFCGTFNISDDIENLISFSKKIRSDS